MDNGKGKFVPINDLDTAVNQLQKQYPKHGGIFSIGEIIELKGSKFKVKSIKPTTIRLKLLKKSF